MQTRFLRVHCTRGFFSGMLLSTALVFATFYSLSGQAIFAEDEPAVDPLAETNPEAEQGEDYYELMRVFVDTFQEIDQNYVKEVDRRKLINAAVRGMLAELDPYSNYIAPDDLEHFTEAISQEFGGVGIRVNWDKKDRSIEILTPLPGSPAYKAGLKSGDHIVEINGQSVKEFPVEHEIDSAVELLRGKPGEKVEVGVTHEGSKDVEEVTLVREMIQLDTVLGNSASKDGKWNLMLDEDQKIGYIRLTHFTSRSASEVREAVKSLKKQGMKGLIIDLRFNPGGLLEAAVDISDMFIDEGLIVSTDGRNSAHRTWSAKSFGTFTGFPIAVIVNHYSASASEILSACLQDHNRAIVVGERSWGKGSVQDVIDLEDGKSALKLTTASYHRPSGKNIHRFPNSKESDEWGVTPNEGYLVEFTLQDLRDFQEARQERDVPGNTEIKSTFDDRQLSAAKTYIEEQLKSKETAAETAPEKKEAKEEKPAAKPASKKAAAGSRLPFFAVPRTRAG